MDEQVGRAVEQEQTHDGEDGRVVGADCRAGRRRALAKGATFSRYRTQP